MARPKAEPRRDAERLAALAALNIGADGTTVEPEELKLTGDTVDAGGDVERVLLSDANLVYTVGNPPVQHRADAVPGDVVRISKAQADRLDKLGVTAPVKGKGAVKAAKASDADVEEAARKAAEQTGTPPPSGPSDEDLGAMGAGELVAYVGQNPEAAPRVRELELARPENKQRSTILDATDPEKLENPGQ